MRGVPYGALKNCSSTTYMPLIISVMRKYLPALSNVLSLPSSHRSGRGNRKPCGGGPLGVADREDDVANVAVLAILGIRAAFMGVEDGRTRASVLRDLVEAILK